MNVDEVLEKIRQRGNEDVANGLVEAVNQFEDMINVNGGEFWDVFIKGYSRCLLNLGFISYDDVNLINALLFEKYVNKIKGGDKTE